MFFTDPTTILGFLIVILASFFVGGLIGRKTVRPQVVTKEVTKEVRVEVPVEGAPPPVAQPQQSTDNSFAANMGKALVQKQNEVKANFEEDVQKMLAANKISTISARKAYDNLPVTNVRKLVNESVVAFNRSSQHYVLGATVGTGAGYSGYIVRITLGSR